MPRGARLLIVAGLVVLGFVGVVLPLFSNAGVPMAEIAGALPSTATAGKQVSVDIAVDNVGDSVIGPLCVAMSGPGATLVSADFQGLETISAVANRVCGGELTGQETISLTLVVRFDTPGSTAVTLVPEQGTTVIGPAFTNTVTVS